MSIPRFVPPAFDPDAAYDAALERIARGGEEMMADGDAAVLSLGIKRRAEAIRQARPRLMVGECVESVEVRVVRTAELFPGR